MSEKPLRTIDVARRTGVSVNTVRLYEAQGYLPPVPRASNGYRLFTELHVRHVQLIRYAMRCTWIGGNIRRTALEVLTTAAKGDYRQASVQAASLVDLLHVEQTHADEAIHRLEEWVSRKDRQNSKRKRYIGATAKRLHVTVDELRSWERNGLLTVPRASNGYRVYGEREIDRLLVIRTLRRARYSLLSILHLLQRLDAGHTDHLREALNTPPPDTDIEHYPTNSWLATLQEMRNAAEAMGQLLDKL